MRRTKIICTLGPASNNDETLEAMLKAGMNVARLNFSHGSYDFHEETVRRFRRVRDRLKLPAAVMLDTKGPEIRLGELPAPRQLRDGDTLTLTTRKPADGSDAVFVNYAALPQKLSGGNRILVDDGKIVLETEACTDTEIICRVISGGTLSSRKSLNVPYIHLDMPYMSEKDKEDILFGIKQDVDFVAASFVRSRDDVICLRKFLDYHGGHAIKIIAKIENNEGVENFDEILAQADGIMVARGDMGVEIAFERLPGIQKKFIRRCYEAGKMVITATQMLESMVHSYNPTRAEITDVANAVFDGTSAVMLSGETAMGDHPARVVEVMATITAQAEQDALEMNAYRGIHYQNDGEDTTNAVCDAACTMARDLQATAIIAVTKSGYTARRVSKFRPAAIIVAATPEKKTFHQLSLSWGVAPVLALYQDNTNKLFRHAIDCAAQIDLIAPGDRVVITAGVPLDQSGSTNMLKVETIER